MKNIFITESTEGELNDEAKFTGKRGRVLWLNFKSSKGNGAMINLNNLAHDQPYVIKKAMQEAIQEYEIQPTADS